jgi:O-antigen/teichoic acid export membrane protein
MDQNESAPIGQGTWSDRLLRGAREGISPVRRVVDGLRRDPLYRTSLLLVGDGVLIGAFSGLFLVIATHVWKPHSIGVVSALFGATGLIESFALLGLPAMIVAYLAREPDQALLARGALTISVSVGVVLLAGLWLIPGHFDVPLGKLGTSTPEAVVLTMVLVAGMLVGGVIDPAFLARQEVSWSVGKDVIALAVRFIALGILAGSGTVGYLGVAVIYVSSAALIDLVLIRWRLRRMPRPRKSLGLRLVRAHASFAAGSQTAVLVSYLPTSLLPIMVLSRLGSAAAAYAAIPVTIISFLVVVPAMTAQSLFAEITAHPEEFLVPIRKALRAVYIFTLPIALVFIVVAPNILQLFGHGYSVHGSDLLRWGAASSIFFCLNYISDIVLLARKLVAAYVTANVVGAAFVLTSLFIAVRHGLGWLGLGWFVGQACYCAVSCIILATYVGRRNLLPTLRHMWRSVGTSET